MKDVGLPAWAEKIRNLLRAKSMGQAELANALGVSGATVSRWLSGQNEPAPQAYVALGNLAASPDDVYFWERAGVQLKHLENAPLKRFLESSEVNVSDLKRLTHERSSGVVEENQSVVAIPVFGVCAYADEFPPQENVSLARASIEEFLTASSSWCPHPDNLISMHVCGESMFPTMQNDALIVVDLAAKDRDQLNQELVVVSHKDLGFKVARMQRLRDSYVLVPANPSCMPIDITNASKWHVIGKVLWWVTRDGVRRTP